MWHFILCDYCLKPYNYRSYCSAVVKIIAWREIWVHLFVTRGEIWVKSNVDYVNNKCQWICTVTTRHQRHVMELQAWDLLQTYAYRKTALSDAESMLGQHRGLWTSINPYSAGIDFSRQNLTSVDVRFWRLKSLPRCNSKNISNGRRLMI